MTGEKASQKRILFIDELYLYTEWLQLPTSPLSTYWIRSFFDLVLVGREVPGDSLEEIHQQHKPRALSDIVVKACASLCQ